MAHFVSSYTFNLVKKTWIGKCAAGDINISKDNYFDTYGNLVYGKECISNQGRER